MGNGRSYLANFNTDSHRKPTEKKKKQSSSGLRFIIQILQF